MLMPRNYVDNMFDRWMAPFDRDFFSRMDPFFASTRKELMRTDIKENDEGYELEVDLPGYKKEDVTVSLENGYLTIAGKHSTESEEKDEENRYLRRERSYGSCSRSFYIGDGVSREDISARMEDGILHLRFPKADQKRLEENKYIAIEG